MSNLTLSREQVKQLIAVGHVLVMFKRDKELVVLRMNHFLDSHPGFALPVLHFGEFPNMGFITIKVDFATSKKSGPGCH